MVPSVKTRIAHPSPSSLHSSPEQLLSADEVVLLISLFGSGSPMSPGPPAAAFKARAIVSAAKVKTRFFISSPERGEGKGNPSQVDERQIGLRNELGASVFLS